MKRCIVRWLRRGAFGHLHRCVREAGHEGTHWCVCGEQVVDGAPL